MLTQHGYRSPDLSEISTIVIGWLTDPNPGTLATQTALWDDDIWETARWAIQIHGIGPLLDRAFGGQAEAAVLQPRLRTYLADQRRLSGERVVLLLQDLVELLDAAHDAAIQVLPMKGSLLATQYYPEPGLRPMNDLDILIHPSDEKRMVALLAKLGYQPVLRSPQHLGFARPENYGPTVSWDGEHPANPRHIDLHMHIHERLWGIQYDLTTHVWADSKPGDLMGAPARLMGPAALLHHLAVHATGDLISRWIRLLHLHDIALVAPKVTDNGWQRIIASVRAQREERYLYPALALTTQYYPLIPEAVLKALRPGVPPALLKYLDTISIEQVSFCNPAASTVAEKLRWFRPGREQLSAIFNLLAPKPSDLALSSAPMSHSTPLRGYIHHYAQLIGWIARRVRRMPRDRLASYAALASDNSYLPATHPPSLDPTSSRPDAPPFADS